MKRVRTRLSWNVSRGIALITPGSWHALPSLPLRSFALSTGTILLWMFFSLAVIFYNKELFDLGFKFPLAVTGMGQLFSSLGGLALSHCTGMSLKPAPTKRFFLSKLAPVAASFAACLFLGNYAFLRLPVSFMQMLKSFAPAVTLLMCVWAGLETLSVPLVLSVMTITVGIGSSVLIEGSKDGFHFLGFLCFFLSTFAEGARTVLSEKLLGAERYNTAQILVYVGSPTSACLLLASAIWEGRELCDVGFVLVQQHFWRFILAFTLGFGVNFSNYLALRYTSSLTFKVVGCIKNTVALLFGVVVYNDDVTKLQLLGYLTSIAGFIWYSYVKIELHAYRHRGMHIKNK